MKFLFTCDVELTSIPENRENEGVADRLLQEGIPRVLDVCSRLDVPTTFYFTANLAKLRPESVQMVRDQGHEVGCHGLSHGPDAVYDTLSFDEQVQSLRLARSIIERSGAMKVHAFRAPEARINEDTVRALSDVGFTSDSSICPQRLDGPLSRGFRGKLKWLVAPRGPYFLSTNSVITPGNSDVLEIPISALIVPFIGTAMRISPGTVRILRRVLFNEARKRPEHPVVFLFHPNECLDYGSLSGGRDPGGAIIADRLRTSLKLRNLGRPAIRLAEDMLGAARDAGFEFTTATQFRMMYRRNAS